MRFCTSAVSPTKSARSDRPFCRSRFLRWPPVVEHIWFGVGMNFFGATPVEKRIIHNGNNYQQPKFSKLKNLSIMAAQISVKIKPQETTQTASKTLGPEELRPEQRKADRQVEHIYICV